MVKVKMEKVEVNPETEWVMELVRVDHQPMVQEQMEDQRIVYPMVDFLVVEEDTITEGVLLDMVEVVLFEFFGEKTEPSLLKT